MNAYISIVFRKCLCIFLFLCTLTTIKFFYPSTNNITICIAEFLCENIFPRILTDICLTHQLFSIVNYVLCS